MNELQELIERTEWLQHQVDELRHTLDQMRGDLTVHREALYAKLAGSNHQAVRAEPGAWSPVSVEDQGADHTAATESSGTGSERRSLPRRRGHPVPILIRRSQADLDTVQGWVIDRSPEGLCLLADEDVAVGTLLNVRPAHHAAGLQWFLVQVRNCRPERAAWILGCQFVRELSWDDLRLFS